MSSRPIPFTWILNYFKDDPPTLARGKIFLQSNKLREFEFECKADVCYVTGMVESSFRPNVLHPVSLKFRIGSAGFNDAKCDCVRGAVLCSHIACLMLHAEKTISKTDVPLKSQIPRTSFLVTPAEQLFEKKKNSTSLYSTKADLPNYTAVYSTMAMALKGSSCPLKHTLFAYITPYTTRTERETIHCRYPSLPNLLLQLKSTNQVNLIRKKCQFQMRKELRFSWLLWAKVTMRSGANIV